MAQRALDQTGSRELSRGWIASGNLFDREDLQVGLHMYRAAGGTRAVLANIFTDLRPDPVLTPAIAHAKISLLCTPGEARERLEEQIEQIGFDDALLVCPFDAPEQLETIRNLISFPLPKDLAGRGKGEASPRTVVSCPRTGSAIACSRLFAPFPFLRRSRVALIADLIDVPVDLQPVPIRIAELHSKLTPGAAPPIKIDRHLMPPQCSRAFTT